MEDKRTTKLRSKAQIDGKSADRRMPRTIRFTDSEWANVSQAAAAANISTATFARNAVLNAIAEPAAASGGPLPPGLLELVKCTYRSAYILSTLKRDDMIREGRPKQLDALWQAPHDLSKRQNLAVPLSPTADQRPTGILRRTRSRTEWQ